MATQTQVPHRTVPKAQAVTVTGGDIAQLAKSFERGLRAANRSAATVKIYTVAVAQFANFLAERGMPLVVAHISREHVEEWLLDVLNRRSAGTAETRYRGLRAFFEWALAEGEITVTPMARVKRPQLSETPPPILTEDQQRALLATCNGKDFEARRDLAILRLAIDTGLRRSELAYLTVEDVDLDSNQARVVLGKFRRGRVVPFGRKAAQAIDRYLRIRAQHRHASEPALWLGRQGPLADGAVDLMVRRRSRQAGLTGVHLHQLRHSFADAWLRSDGTEGDLMELAGWRSRAMIERYGSARRADRARDSYRRRQSPGDRL